MRRFVEQAAAVGGDEWRPATPLVQTLDLHRHVVEVLGAEEVAVRRGARGLHEVEHLVEPEVGRAGGEGEVAAAPFRVQAVGGRDRLGKRRLPGPVLTDEEAHPGVEGERVEIPDRREVEGISVAVGAPVLDQPRLREVGPRARFRLFADPSLHRPVPATRPAGQTVRWVPLSILPWELRWTRVVARRDRTPRRSRPASAHSVLSWILLANSPGSPVTASSPPRGPYSAQMPAYRPLKRIC